MGDDSSVGIAGPGPAEGGETGEADFGGGLFGGMAGITGADGSAADLGNLLSSRAMMSENMDMESLLNFDQMEIPDLSANMPVVSANPIADFFSKNNLLTNLLALVSKNPNISMAANMMSKATMDPSKAIVTSLASMVNPVLGMVVGQTGLGQGLFSGTVGNGGQSSVGPGNGTNMDMMEGLAGLYGNYQNNKNIGGMLGGLQSLYSQDSPYAQAMRQQLQRRDAAGGRRSQYGPREVELQAKLAQMASNQIPAMAQLNNSRMANRNAMINNVLAYGKKSGLFDRMGAGLQGMFGGGMFDTSATQALQTMPNVFDMGGGFGGQLPPDVGFDTLGGLFGG